MTIKLPVRIVVASGDPRLNWDYYVVDGANFTRARCKCREDADAIVSALNEQQYRVTYRPTEALRPEDKPCR